MFGGAELLSQELTISAVYQGATSKLLGLGFHSIPFNSI